MESVLSAILIFVPSSCPENGFQNIEKKTSNFLSAQGETEEEAIWLFHLTAAFFPLEAQNPKITSSSISQTLNPYGGTF